MTTLARLMPRGVTISIAMLAQWCLTGAAQTFNPKAIFNTCAQAVVYIETEKGSGTGFFIHPQYIVTNKHVVQRWGTGADNRRYLDAYNSARDIRIQLRSGRWIDVVQVLPLVEYPDIDIAVLRVSSYDGVVLPIKPTVADVGEEIVLIGHPLGSKWTQTSGTVSNIIDETFIQFNAALDRGNSGSPAIDKRGQVVGIHMMGIYLSMTGKFGIRSDVLRELLDRYRIPYSTDPLMIPTTEEHGEFLRTLNERESNLNEREYNLNERESRIAEREERLRQMEQQLVRDRIQLAQDSARFAAKVHEARTSLLDYETKLEQLQNHQRELEKLHRKLLSREEDLNERERWISAKEQQVRSMLSPHFSLDFAACPTYNLHAAQLVPLRLVSGLYYRFGIVRDAANDIERADKVGIMLGRQIAPTGWEQDEAAFAIEFRNLVRIMLGMVVRQPDRVAGVAIPPPRQRYTASIMLDFAPSSPLLTGIGLTAQTDQKMQSTALMLSFLLGYELNFFHW